MASEQIMNTGWHRGGFEPPLSRNATSIWHDAINSGFRTLYNFNWLSGGRLLRFESTPFVQREVGMPNFGGTYEHCVLPFDLADASDMPERLIALGASNGTAPLEPNGMNVTVRSGAYSNESRHWVELFDPYLFERTRLSAQGFVALAQQVSTQAENVSSAARIHAEAKLKSGSEEDRLHYQRIAQLEQQYLISQALLLACFFSDRRIPLSSIMQLLLWLPSFKAAYECVKDLPSDGSASELPLRSLLLLYSSKA